MSGHQVPPGSGIAAAPLTPFVPGPAQLAGRVERTTLTSAVLAGNPLGDPAERPVTVYLPPQYDADPGRRLPSVYVLQGYTGAAPMWDNRSAFRRPFLENVDAAVADGTCPPVIVVLVDAWTAYGGSQFVDSPGTGRYLTYICDEVVPYVDGRYRTLASAAHRGVAGKSSGGFGAMVFGMLRPDLFGGFATHAGDTLYEACYVPEFLRVARALRDRYEGSYDVFWRNFWERTRQGQAMSRPEDGSLVMVYGVAAAFSAEPDARVALPFDIATGQLVEPAWQRWLEWDPVRMAPAHADALLSARAVWIDAGRSDDWYLDLGAEAYRRQLAGLGVDPARVHFELFDATHAGIDYRYPLSLAYLARELGG